MLPSILKQGLTASSKTRVQGGATEVTVKATAGILHRIVVTNAHATAVQTLTVNDGAGGGNVLGVYEIPIDDSRTLEFGVRFDNDIRVTPSDAAVDAAIIYD